MQSTVHTETIAEIKKPMQSIVQKANNRSNKKFSIQSIVQRANKSSSLKSASSLLFTMPTVEMVNSNGGTCSAKLLHVI